MRIKLFQVDAFADKVFAGNPAAVCPLDHWIEEHVMQHIAQENNLSATAFFVAQERPLHIRWFTPTTEIVLCGHATLASAHVLCQHLGYRDNPIQFDSASGPLQVIVEDPGLYTLDFPQDSLRAVSDLPASGYFHQNVLETHRGETDYLLLLENEDAVANTVPEFQKLMDIDGRGFIVTAPGNSVDYVSRCFYPQAGIPEDPATGSSHTTLAPYWSKKLGKQKLKAHQLSLRGGTFETEWLNDRVLITGRAVSYMDGIIEL